MGKLLSSLAKKAPSKSGSKKKEQKPEVNIPDLNDHINGFLKAHEDEKDASGRKRQFKAMIAAKAASEHQKICQAGNGFQGSFVLNGRLLVYAQYNSAHHTVLKGAGEDTVTKIEEIQKMAEEAFGKDDAEKFLTTKYAIEFKDGAMDDKVLAKIVKAVGGPEEFERLFEVTSSLVATKELFERRFTDPKVAEAAKQLQDQGLLKPYSPSLKPA